jgi:pimeloyl-ACP methyl ester carboxylesterase
MPKVIPNWTLHEGTGPHLLLVHGFLSSSAQWQENLNALGSVCQPVTVNLFGHAGSPAPLEDACYHPEYYGRCFEQIRETLGAQQWFVLGYSLGAGLTIRYALDYPGRIYGHLFTNSTSAFADPELLDTWRGSLPETAARIHQDGLSALEGIPVHPKHAWRLPKQLRSVLLEDAQHHQPAGILKTLETTNLNASIRDRAGENTRPTCLLFGAREKRFHPYKKFAETNMPELAVAQLDAGHGMNMETPETFNTAVRNFLTRCAT